jgi:hypothetical protein
MPPFLLGLFYYREMRLQNTKKLFKAVLRDVQTRLDVNANMRGKRFKDKLYFINSTIDSYCVFR